ncbi:MAG: SUMF1/EgtB/PvdO family nonheme iron enzyme, partial [Gammaproteobacteria bacterium]|nr:SUMF1/EgtB/PvdO family nonheme iron enzyme [Gammaproteobacteria bacterium]
MKVEFEIASDQIDGARDYQEDAYMVNQLGDDGNGDLCSLVIMADGMGGHAAGNVASNMVVATFNKSFQSDFPTKDVGGSLTDSLHRANDQIHASVKETPALSGMGCTMVSAYLEDDRLFWVSVGDSHLYLLRDRELIKQNADHSYGAYLDMMSEQGIEMEDQEGMSRNMLMSAMTGEDISSIDVPDTPVKLRLGDRVIVASDGLDTLGAGAIIQYSSWSITAKECVYALLKAIEDANRINQDNTTLIVIDVKERSSVQGAGPAQAKQVAREVPAARVSDTYVPEEVRQKEPGSYKGLMWLIVLILLGAGGYLAWKTGVIQNTGDVVDDIETIIKESLPTNIEPELEQTPAPDLKPDSEPEVVIPEPEPEYVDSPDVFRDRLKSGGNGPTMIRVPGGTYRMGGGSSIVGPDEVPRHEVTINPFLVSVYEVTYAEYDRFARSSKRKSPKSSGLDRKT